MRVVVLPIVDQPSPDCLNKGFQITQPQGVSRVLSVSQGGNKEEGGEGRGQRILKGAAPLEGFGGCRPPNVTALSSIACPLPAPSHNRGQNWLRGAGFHRNKSCGTSSAPWRSIIDKGARPEPWAGLAKCGGSRRTWQKVENRTGFGPHISTRNQGLPRTMFQTQAHAGNLPPGPFLSLVQEHPGKIPGGWRRLAKHADS